MTQTKRQNSVFTALCRAFVTGAALVYAFGFVPHARAGFIVSAETRQAAKSQDIQNKSFLGFTIPGRFVKVLPTIKQRVYHADVTAYTSSVEECDADPFTTADGSTTRDGIIATNFLPFNTKVRIPALFGDKIFEVHDRMNTKYSDRVDVWMSDKKAMRKFGINRNAEIEIVEMGDGSTQWAKLAMNKTNMD